MKQLHTSRRPRAHTGDSKERGAVGVLAVVTMVALIAVGAIAVDLGQVYAERTQLQNGADAAALGIGAACYDRTTKTCLPAPPAPATGSWQQWAQALANGNANDGATTITNVDLSVPNQVTVTTSTLDGTTHAGFLSPMFASAFKALAGPGAAGPVTVGAQATVAITIPKSGASPLPLAISACELDVHSSATNPIPQKIIIQGGTKDCNGKNPSNQIIPGGFAWLNPTGPGPCEVRVTAGPESDISTWIKTSSGASLPNGCNYLFQPDNPDYILDKTVALPLYDDYSGSPPTPGPSGTGSNIWYHVQKWAGFHILGWNLSGISGGNNSAGPPVWNGSEKGIYGYFVGYSGDPSTFTDYTTDPSYEGNVVVPQLIK